MPTYYPDKCGWPLCPKYHVDADTFRCPTPIGGSPCQGPLPKEPPQDVREWLKELGLDQLKL